MTPDPYAALAELVNVIERGGNLAKAMVKAYEVLAQRGDHAPEWSCSCDDRGIGKPGVTCGDCPRDYGHKVLAPTTVPKRTPLPLGNEQIDQILDRERMCWATAPPTYEFAHAFARAIERAVVDRT